jgi:hypothetical protein
VWQWIASIGPRYPFSFGVAIATVKTAVADAVVQKYIEGQEEIDTKRLAVFTVFGFAYLGVFQYFLYVTAFTRWFKHTERFTKLPFREKLRDVPGLKDLVKQIAFDNFIHAPFILLPAYYVMKQSIQGTSNTAREVVVDGLTTYKKNAWEDSLAYWKIWVPGDMLSFSLPLWARLPVNHGISFLYVCVLSFMRGAATPSTPSSPATPAPAAPAASAKDKDPNSSA